MYEINHLIFIDLLSFLPSKYLLLLIQPTDCYRSYWTSLKRSCFML